MKATAIVVNDDPDKVEIFSEFLKLKGMEVIGTGNNGQETFELFHTLKPDVVILEMKMPEYDGIDLIKKKTLMQR